MAKIIAISNQKGGVAKTTTSTCLATGLKQRGYKVLAVDMDPQGNLSDSIGANNRDKDTVYELLNGSAKASDAIQSYDVFDIIPANIMLAGSEQELSQIGKEQRLKERLEEVEHKYDYIIIDTPPTLGILTINAFTAADEVIIPTTAGIFAATGIFQLFDTINNVKKYCNSKVKVSGILFTKFNDRSNNNKDMKDLTEQIASHMDAKIFKTFIRTSVAIEESQARKVDIFTYKKNSTVAIDYNNFIDEYLKEGV